MNEPETIRTGDQVRITYQNRTFDGVVLLASANSRSLMLGFDAMSGGYAGMMPVGWNPETRVRRPN